MVYNVDDQTVREAMLQWKKHIQQKWQNRVEDQFITLSADQMTFWCWLHMSNNTNDENTCKRCFMMCNTILFVSQLIWKYFR